MEISSLINVLLDKDFEAHILDFGLAKVLLATNTTQPIFQKQWMATSNVYGTFGYVVVGWSLIIEVPPSFNDIVSIFSY